MVLGLTLRMANLIRKNVDVMLSLQMISSLGGSVEGHLFTIHTPVIVISERIKKNL